MEKIENFCHTFNGVGLVAYIISLVPIAIWSHISGINEISANFSNTGELSLNCPGFIAICGVFYAVCTFALVSNLIVIVSIWLFKLIKFVINKTKK